MDGVDVRDYDQKALRNKIGYVSQKATLFAGTVRSNVAFGDNGRAEFPDEDVVDAVYTAQANEFVEKMMDTYDINVLLSLIKGIYVKQYQASRRNKKLCQIDQRYLKSAEDITYGEFAIALESTPEKIKDFVKDQVICQMQG